MYHYDNGHIYNCHKCKHVAIVPGCIYHKDYHPSENNYPCDWKGERIMTQEEKQLLLTDLCTRLPYGVMCDRLGHPLKLVGVHPNKEFALEFDRGEYMPTEYTVDDVKPYLRPMSSMTEEEKMQLKEEHLKDARLFAEALTKAAEGDTSMRGKVIPHFAADWCNKNHFDFRGLIPMGLALEAPEGMY